ncbi:uncharacterized protein LOC112350274 [Selaginella moellendorffii]|uniref:uncharacterized protein LOC112350274 n=1 Tax=Selaginella moellendorffii TaxID=88036 RepID=UPI000D1C68DF|nr:uncharacterized protein LOC112350274 [Selaginella moellendorffii]|eukprot:XP_024541947.1 uncharacterized protein LOC112350274 [Selaginella moellendorffii]
MPRQKKCAEAISLDHQHPSLPVYSLPVLGCWGMQYSSQGQRTHNQKAAEMTGNDIFKKGGYGTHVEKSLSDAKRREMIGSDIFSEEKPPPSQQSVSNRIRKPPGGPSTIVLG